MGRDRRLRVWVIGMSILVFFAQTWGFHLLFDGLTYSVLARNILSSGDWLHLHYGLEQYPEFFQHPPLAIWIQAILYKFIGHSEPASRLLPASLAVLSVVLVFEYLRRRAGLAAGVFASVVLVSSTRFVKWGSNFYLDGILSFFGLAAALLLSEGFEFRNRNPQRAMILMFLAGVSIACAFMVKGIAALPALGACGVVLLFHVDRKIFLPVFAVLMGAVFPLFLWCGLGNGREYIEKYLEVSARGRTDFNQFSIHPWRNLYLIWLPWFPVFAWGLLSGLRRFFQGDRLGRERVMWGFCALLVPLAYSFGVVYMEHYLTPFYPLAAISCGLTLAHWMPLVRERAERWMWVGLGVGSIFLATLAPDVNFQKLQPADRWLLQVRNLKPGAQKRVRQIAFTSSSGELWLNLAILLGRSDSQAIGAFDPARSTIPGTLLVATPDEVPSVDWVELPCLRIPDFKFYSSRNENYCD